MEECPVCYENAANCKLVCGHHFCKSCVKTWYMKGGSCPMCRKNVHYRRMPIKKWKAESEEEKKQVVFQESFDYLLETIMTPLKFEFTDNESIPDTPGFIQVMDSNVLTLHRTNMPTHELEDLEKTFRAIKDVISTEEIDYVLNDTEEYYSDRHIHLKNRTSSETGHWYPHQKTPKAFKAHTRFKMKR